MSNDDTSQYVVHRWISEYGNTLLRIAYLYSGDKHLSEDFLQETLVRAFQMKHQIRNPESEKAWLTRILINQCLSYRKRHRREVSTEPKKISAGSVTCSAEQSAFEDWETHHLLASIRSLPIRYQSPIILFYFEELSTKMIADILHVKENTVRIRLHRGRNLLRLHLEEVLYVDTEQA